MSEAPVKKARRPRGSVMIERMMKEAAKEKETALTAALKAISSAHAAIEWNVGGCSPELRQRLQDAADALAARIRSRPQNILLLTPHADPDPFPMDEHD